MRIRINKLGDYTAPDVNWRDVQKHYKTLFEAAKLQRGLTQDKIADAVGLTQPDISRLMKMEGDDGPQVATLLKAIDGLGVPISSFFEQIERQTNSDLQSREEEIKNPRTLAGKAKRGRSATTLSSDREVREAVGQALLRAAASLTDAATTRADESVDREVSDARRKKRVRR